MGTNLPSEHSFYSNTAFQRLCKDFDKDFFSDRAKTNYRMKTFRWESMFTVRRFLPWVSAMITWVDGRKEISRTLCSVAIGFIQYVLHSSKKSCQRREPLAINVLYVNDKPRATDGFLALSLSRWDFNPARLLGFALCVGIQLLIPSCNFQIAI